MDTATHVLDESQPAIAMQPLPAAPVTLGRVLHPDFQRLGLEFEAAALRNALNDYGIHRVRPGEPPMPGTRATPKWLWQFQPRKVLLDRTMARLMVTLFDAALPGAWPEYDLSLGFNVAGIESGGSPLAMAIGMLSRYPVTTLQIRRTQKPVGTRAWIEGSPDYTKPTIVVDDLTSSGNSMAAALQRVQDEGLILAPVAFAPICAGRPERYPRHTLGLYWYGDFDRHWEEWLEHRSRPWLSHPYHGPLSRHPQPTD